jgi:hypothetical protein
MKYLLLALQYLPYVLQGVTAVELAVGAGKGQSKKQLVLNAVIAGAKVGETVPEDHVKLIGGLIDSVVSDLNTAGVFGKSPVPAA